MKKKVTAKVPMYAKINNIPYKKPIKKTKQTNAESILEKKREGLYLLCLITCKGLKMKQANNSYSSVLVIVSILTHS